MGLAHKYEIQQQGIFGANGSEFLFIGTGSNPEKIKSMESIDVAWCEQGERMSASSWEILVPTIRAPRSEIVITFNPDEENDPTYQRFVVNPPPDCISLEVNWQDNPWFPEVLRAEKDYLYRVDPEAAANVWGGECLLNASPEIFRGKYVVESFSVPAEVWERKPPRLGRPVLRRRLGICERPDHTREVLDSRCAKYGKTQGSLYLEDEAVRHRSRSCAHACAVRKDPWLAGLPDPGRLRTAGDDQPHPQLRVPNRSG